MRVGMGDACADWDHALSAARDSSSPCGPFPTPWTQAWSECNSNFVMQYKATHPPRPCNDGSGWGLVGAAIIGIPIAIVLLFSGGR